MNWFEPEMRDRSREIMGSPGSKRTVEGPSKRPARSPCTRRDNAWPASRPSEISWLTDDPNQASEGANKASTTMGKIGSIGIRHRRHQRGVEGTVLGREQWPAERRFGQRTQQRPPSLGRFHPPRLRRRCPLLGGPHRVGSAACSDVPPNSMT